MFLLLLLLSYFFLSYNTLYTFFFPHFTPKTMMDGLQTVTCRQSYKRCPSSPVIRIAHQTRTRRQIRNVLCCVYSSLRARSRVVCIPDVYVKKIIIMKILNVFRGKFVHRCCILEIVFIFISLPESSLLSLEQKKQFMFNCMQWHFILSSSSNGIVFQSI